MMQFFDLKIMKSCPQLVKYMQTLPYQLEKHWYLAIAMVMDQR
jgi:hypothetical protein